ncbi:MAG: hypothetical protein LBV58_03775 [Acholeplasmatales bacterium]|nr:hypothetical protein [Acholeplasmatales bacterium]
MKQPQTSKLAFIVKNNKIFEKVFTFDFYGGFAISQKQKTIDAFHSEIAKYGDFKVLEISSKSRNPIGNALSAFNLLLDIKGNKYPVECIYQSSKVFNDNIQYKNLLYATPPVAKKTIQDNVFTMELELISFNCFGKVFPLNPVTFFYDYIYVAALYQNPSIASEVINYDCFTDVEFNYKKQVASQARSCAIYIYLKNNNLLEEAISDIEKFKEIYGLVIIPYNKILELN